MIKILAIGSLVVGLGATGYYGERFFRSAKAPQAQIVVENSLLFKMPLGHFTMLFKSSRQYINLKIDLDVYVMGARSFSEINGAVGRTTLRDAAVGALSEIAATSPNIMDSNDKDLIKRELSEQIVRKLYTKFPSVRTARINSILIKARTKD